MKPLFRTCLFFLAFLFSLPVLAQWYSTTLSLGRWRMGATSVGNKALFAGGYTYKLGFDLESSQVDIYDGATNQWMTTQLSAARHSIAAISVGNLAFFAGGQRGLSASGSQMYSNVDIYDANTNQWSTAQLSEGRSNIAVTTTGGKVFFVLGTTYFFPSYAMDIYDLNTKQWSAVQMPVAYTFARATGAGNKVVVTAGSRYSLSQFHSYDILTGQWASKTVPEARAEVTMLGVGTKVFFAGGSTSNGTVSNRIDIYDTATDQWTTATLSQARSSITTITVGTKTFFAGGNPTSNAVDIYDAMSNQWTTAMLSQGRSGIIATSAGTKVFFAGGEGSSIVDIYDTATGQWSTTQLPQARNDLAAVQAGERALFAESGPGTLGSNISGKVDIYTTNSALPVNLMSFSGRWIENIGTQLSWTTSWETHNDHFQIQRSSNAKNFETIGRVAGKGTTSERTDYSFTDIATPDPVNYYRLKQVDLDGSTHFSNIIAITRQPEPQATKLSVWPSPTTGTLTLELTGGKTIQQVGVYDLHGRKLTSQVGAQATADVSSLPTGAYVVEVLTTDGQQLRSRFVKQ